MDNTLVIGVLGGMGPEATVNCFDKLIRNTPASRDQEHLEVIIVNNPKVPDRTAGILGTGASPLPVLRAGIDTLKRAGVDFVIIPCVTAHYFLHDLITDSDPPVLSILDAVVEHIRRAYVGMTTVGLMGTSGTVRSGIFQKRLTAAGIDTLVCEPAVQEQVMAAIYDIKSAQPARSPSEITAALAGAARHLIDRGAQGIIAGCTEIPLALSQEDISAPYFDSLLILARAAIRRAGREPISHPASPEKRTDR